VTSYNSVCAAGYLGADDAAWLERAVHGPEERLQSGKASSSGMVLSTQLDKRQLQLHAHNETVYHLQLCAQSIPCRSEGHVPVNMCAFQLALGTSSNSTSAGPMGSDESTMMAS
jgi:hypothetical protein